MIIAGIDEAGYGPLLGPLVVSRSALEIPSAADASPPLTIAELPDLWKMLQAAVAKKPDKKSRLLIADSKVVHHLTDGSKLLERGVLAFTRAHFPDFLPADYTGQRLLALLSCANHQLADHPWYDGTICPLPLWCDAGDLSIATNILTAALARTQIKIAALRTALVSEGAFNQLVTTTQNKASALLTLTLQHLYFLHTHFGCAPGGLVVGVDKQGGRDHYTALLLRNFPDTQLKVLTEGDENGSSYLLTDDSRRTVIHFREKAESHFLPTALSSMICKYLREMCMECFNDWWGERIPDLKATAGYYQDGTRWLSDVTPHLARLGIRREQLVRIR